MRRSSRPRAPGTPSWQRQVTWVRAALGSAWRSLNAAFAPALHRGYFAASPGVTMYCVYRQRNAANVVQIIHALPSGSTAHLHALDATAPELRTKTRSSGSGYRMRLLGALIEQHPPRPGDYVLLADDDVRFVGRFRTGFPAVAAAAGLDFSMPAHRRGSAHTFRLTEEHAWSTARLTRFVEVGPLLLVSPRAMAAIYPFPPEARMGWGLDVLWSTLSRRGYRLGIVDATPMMHLGAVGAAYDQAYERRQLEKCCAVAGVESAYDLAEGAAQAWRPWTSRPPWQRVEPGRPHG